MRNSKLFLHRFTWKMTMEMPKLAEFVQPEVVRVLFQNIKAYLSLPIVLCKQHW